MPRLQPVHRHGGLGRPRHFRGWGWDGDGLLKLFVHPCAQRYPGMSVIGKMAFLSANDIKRHQRPMMNAL